MAGEPMLKAEGRMELAVLRKHGASIRELARVTGHSRNTVRRYLRGGETAERRKPTAKRAEKLDGFKDYIVDRMRAASPARIPAAVLFREIKERGYRGERFVGYLKGSFWVPFVASMRQLGLAADKHAANAAVSRWLREVANARVHATTGEIPAVRLLTERARFQMLPAAYGGRSARNRDTNRVRKAVLGYQHPLAVY